jgi:uncharacterized protein YjbI with pentapeptide repeats
MRRSPYRLAGTLVAVAVLLAFGALIFVPLLLHPNLSNAELGAVPDARTRITLQQAQAQLQNDTRATLLQSFAGLVLVAGALATWRQVHISRHAQITDRMTRAVDQTASDNVHVRVSGIYALERIHKDSQEDRQTITRILTAFIRIRAPWTAPPQWTHRHDTPALDNGMLRLGLRAEDVQLALYTLADRARPDDERPLYLSFADLRLASMARQDWRRIYCHNTNLAGASLQNRTQPPTG